MNAVAPPVLSLLLLFTASALAMTASEKAFGVSQEEGPPSGIEPAAKGPSTSLPDSERSDSEQTEWISIIGPEGPVGISKIGKNIVHCGDVELLADSKSLRPLPGTGVVAATSKLSNEDASNLYSKQPFGDCELQLEFLIGKGSNSGVKLQARYEIQLYDSYGKQNISAKECGGIYPHWTFKKGGGLNFIDQGVPPRSNACLPAGQWQTLQITFKAPRFDDSGEKTQDARFVKVVMNDQVIHEDVSVDSPTGNASTPMPEVALAPLMLQLDHGAVAFRNVRIRILD